MPMKNLLICQKRRKRKSVKDTVGYIWNFRIYMKQMHHMNMKAKTIMNRNISHQITQDAWFRNVVNLNLKESVQYCHILPVLEKMMRPIWASQSTESSWVFFKSPARRFEKVTCLVVGFSILLIAIFPRPIIIPMP